MEKSKIERIYEALSASFQKHNVVVYATKQEKETMLRLLSLDLYEVYDQFITEFVKEIKK